MQERKFTPWNHHTPTGYIPMQSHVEAILAMCPPKNIKELYGFIKCINFIKKHIPKQSDLIRPLMQLTRKGVPFWLGVELQNTLEKTKAIVLEAVCSHTLMQTNYLHSTGIQAIMQSEQSSCRMVKPFLFSLANSSHLDSITQSQIRNYWQSTED